MKQNLKLLNYIAVCIIFTSCATIKEGKNVVYDGFQYNGILERVNCPFVHIYHLKRGAFSGAGH